MATISIEHLDDITVFSVSGQLCFDEFVDAIKNGYLQNRVGNNQKPVTI